MIKVAIIDDGVCDSEYTSIQSIKQYYVRNGVIRHDKQHYTAITHGSYCAAIIDKYAQCEIELISIKALPYNQKGNIRDLITSIDWCVSKNIGVINLSCGTTDLRDGCQLRDFLFKCEIDRCIIIASQSNTMKYTYPACLSNVIGVRTDPTMFNLRYRINDIEGDGIDIDAASIHGITLGGKKVITQPCNSFATAMVCGIVTKTVYNGCIAQKKEIIKLLRNKL